jgi:hypothetical protein
MVDDESDDKLVKKHALYLIIYAARRGLIEVILIVYKFFEIQ